MAKNTIKLTVSFEYEDLPNVNGLRILGIHLEHDNQEGLSKMAGTYRGMLMVTLSAGIQEFVDALEGSDEEEKE